MTFETIQGYSRPPQPPWPPQPLPTACPLALQGHCPLVSCIWRLHQVVMVIPPTRCMYACSIRRFFSAKSTCAYYGASFELSCPLYTYRFHLHFSPGSSFVPWAVCVIAWETREEQNEGPPFNLPFFPPSPTLSIPPSSHRPVRREVAFHGRLSHRPSVRPSARLSAVRAP